MIPVGVRVLAEGVHSLVTFHVYTTKVSVYFQSGAPSVDDIHSKAHQGHEHNGLDELVSHWQRTNDIRTRRHLARCSQIPRPFISSTMGHPHSDDIVYPTGLRVNSCWPSPSYVAARSTPQRLVTFFISPLFVDEANKEPQRYYQYCEQPFVVCELDRRTNGTHLGTSPLFQHHDHPCVQYHAPTHTGYTPQSQPSLPPCSLGAVCSCSHRRSCSTSP